MEKRMRSERKIRVLLAKVGLDGHDRGIRVLSVMLRDEGIEVIYIGLYQTPERIVKVAIEEDVDVIGLSYLSGGQLVYTQKVIQLMAKNNMDGVLLLVGGIFPKEEIPTLKQMGVEEVFMSSPAQSVIAYIKNNVKRS
jgi:methylmalonyl-CoA mutase C-terminal domain/subunit